MPLPTARRNIIARRRVWLLAAACALAVTAGVLVIPDSDAPAPGALALEAEKDLSSNRPTPRNFTGYGFDQCHTPSQKAMDAWLKNSAFWAVGVYLSGDSRACRDQPNLTATWVSTQLAKGWRIIPITLGPQAHCNSRFPRYQDDKVIAKSSTGNYAAARKQGVAEAKKAVTAAGLIGIVPGSTLWYDLEAFDISKAGCRKSAMRFLSGWTEQLHRSKYVSGAYSSGASGIVAIDAARRNNSTFTEPDRIWVADWSGTPMKFTGKWLADDGWVPGGRMHQYRGGHDEVHGKVRINIDSNFLDLGDGTTAPKAQVHCKRADQAGIGLDFRTYPAMTPDKYYAKRTDALKCLLTEQGYQLGAYDGRWGAKLTKALVAYRKAQGMSADPVASKPVWMRLLSAGRAPLVKYGAAREAVRRLQRTLNVTVGEKLPITGYFGSETTRSVKLYQQAHKLNSTGVVTDKLWKMLKAGKR
ncbi:MAG: DUF1906 domain-containing protein [Nocardioidaceae bacterium]